MAAMMLANLVESILAISITLGSSPGMICMSVAINNTLIIVQFQLFDYFGFVIGKIERSEMAAMMLAVPLYSI